MRFPLRSVVPGRLPVALAALLGSLLAAALTVPLARADDGDDLKKQQAEVDKRKQQAAADAEDSSAALTKANAAVKKAQKALDDANRKLAKARRGRRVAVADLRKQRRVLAAARTDLASARRRAERSRHQVRDTILNNVEHGTPQLQEVAGLLRGASIEELVRRKNYADAVTASQTADLRRLQAGERLVARRERGEQAATTAVAAKEKRASEQVAAVKRLRARVTTLVAGAKQARAKAAAAAKADAKVLAELKAQDAAIAKKIAGLAAGATNRTLATTEHMLGLPVADTYVTQAYGPRVNPVTGESEIHDGIDLHAPCGTPELAAMSGTVVSEEWNDAYGNRLFLFLGKINGHSYTAIYNHISSYKVDAGAKVKKGDTLSLAGDTGWVTACHLHFMIQKDGATVDPTPYLPSIPAG